MSSLLRNPFPGIPILSKMLFLQDPLIMAIPKKNAPPTALPSVEDLVRVLVDQPDKWLDTNNDQLGGEKPLRREGTALEK